MAGRIDGGLFQKKLLEKPFSEPNNPWDWFINPDLGVFLLENVGFLYTSLMDCLGKYNTDYYPQVKAI